MFTTPSPVMHVITNLTGNAGAEIMLARLLRASQDQNILVVPLIDVSERNRCLTANPRVSFIPLQMHSAVDAVGGILKLARLIAKEKPRVVVCWMYHAMVAATVARGLANLDVPVFWNVRQSLDDPASLSRSTRAAVKVGQLLSRSPAGIIYNSERALRLHGEYGYRNSNAIVIPNGFNIPEDVVIVGKIPRIFGIAGRFHPQKDYETFFQAAAAIARSFPHVRFKAVGNGLSPDNPAVAKMLGEIGMPAGALELCGESSDMGAFYRSIDILVLSSRTEGFPNVVAEAMSYAKPVITTDVGDAGVIVKETGWVIPPRNPSALGAALEQTLQLTPEEYLNRARLAKQRIEERYNMATVLQQYENFLSCGPL